MPFVGHRLDKEPAETWRQYYALFRTYSTSTIPPELLAALAQGESSGNPVERTYWRWRWSIRAIPSHAIELASVYLDRNVAAVLARADVTASPQQKQDVAAFIHLCGGGPATAFARRKFQMLADERCGDHLVAAYISSVNAMKRRFLRLAADGGN